MYSVQLVGKMTGKVVCNILWVASKKLLGFEGTGQQIAKVLNVLRKKETLSTLKAQPWKWELCRGIKHAMPKEESRGFAYEVLWNDCSGQCVGETLLTMAVRRREHKRDKNGEELFRFHSHCDNIKSSLKTSGRQDPK